MPARKRPSRLDELADDYAQCHRPGAQKQLEYFRTLKTDEEAVSRAALAQLCNDKRHPHQYRIARSALEESRARLLKNLAQLRSINSFDDLIEMVEEVSGSIPGIGELAVYDTALRIGARFGVEPRRVYLHAGTRKGAKALGLDGNRHALEMDEFPAPLRKLKAREVEDLLCIYEDRLEQDAPRKLLRCKV